MGLFGESRDFQFGTSKLEQNHRQVNRKRRTLFYREKGVWGVMRALVHKKSIGVTWEFEI